MIKLAAQALTAIKLDPGRIERHRQRWQIRHGEWTYEMARQWLLQRTNSLPTMQAFAKENLSMYTPRAFA
ncbi:hypothetical protein, partial [Pseudomonas sp. Sample_9]|uniref:hypothetical protein n=1 Tax=Pseudomonas sp. Sample_9 TaxID=2382158 RepID=UPI0019D59E97